MAIKDPKDRIFVALDTTDLQKAKSLAQSLSGTVGGLKVGKEFFTALGPDGVARLDGGLPVFLDLKFHDIPNTVAGALRAARQMGVAIVNVHAGGGRAMMRAAAEAAAEPGGPGARPLVLGVTLLTSLDDQDLTEVGQRGPVTEQVRRLAKLAQDCGLDGVVCGPQEVELLRRDCGPDFVLLVPGIRPTWSAAGDQKRIMTPAQALDAGADYLVIGRPITGASDPAAAARRILAEIAA